MNIDNVKIPDAWVDITKELSYLEGTLRKLANEHKVSITIEINDAHGMFSIDVDDYGSRKYKGEKTYKGVERTVFKDGEIMTRGYEYEFLQETESGSSQS